jgi:hypothetical protein
MASVAPQTAPAPVRVSFSDERYAISLAQELTGLTSVDVEAVDDTWEVAIDGPVDGRLVVRLLDAVRRSLGADLGAVATVKLDGHDYLLYGGG